MNQIIRLLIIFLIAALLLGLSFPSTLLSAPKSDKHALQIVSSWLDQNPQPLGSKITANIRSVETYKDEFGEPIYHVVYTKPRGFIIVSADDLIEPIIGFFPKGVEFSPLPGNPLGALLKRDMPGRIAMARNNSKSILVTKKVQSSLSQRQRRAKSKWAKLLKDALPADQKATGLPDSSIDDIWVNPIIQSHWSQGTEGGGLCYNYYTPNNYVAGCLATAMAQLMRYYQYPQTGVGTPSFQVSVDNVSRWVSLRGGNGIGGPYLWSNMLLAPDSNITQLECQAIGAVHYDAGVSVNMSYSAGGSSASLQDASTSLVNTFSYGNSVFGANYDYPGSAWLNLTEEQIEKMINTNLDAGAPVILGIDGSGAHAILTDGYGMNGSTCYHHLNMGWAGFDDGWYNMPNIQTANYDYNVVDSVVYNIFPQGSGELISGRITDISGNPVQGVTVTATSGGLNYTDTTNDRGIFALVNVPSNTSFTVTAMKSGYALSPAERNVTTATSANNDFTWLDDWPTSGNQWGVNFTGSVDPMGDIDLSGQIDLLEAILALQTMTGQDSLTPVTINSDIDVDGDSRIGLAEAIFVLQQVAAE